MRRLSGGALALSLLLMLTLISPQQVLATPTTIPTDGPACPRDYYKEGGATDVGTATFSAGRRPIVYVHGWTSSSSMWSGDFNFAGKLEAQLGSPSRTQNFLYDYSRYNTVWASDPNIAACLGQYITEVGEAYQKAGGDGKVIVIGHSMGGLAILYSSSAKFAQYPSADHLGGVVTLDTPYLGSYQGGKRLVSLGNAVGKYLQSKAREHEDAVLPPPDSDALYCLNVHSNGQ
jgi:pimeloyl-ACP methyl ester carboxylesterase